MIIKHDGKQLMMKFKSKGMVVATMSLATGKLELASGYAHTPEEIQRISFHADDFILGQVFEWKGEIIKFGIPEDGECVELDLRRVVGAPKCRIRRSDLEGLRDSAARYIRIHNLGSSNWGAGNPVFQITPGKNRKKLGHLNYNGSFTSVEDDKRDLAAFKEKMKASMT